MRSVNTSPSAGRQQPVLSPVCLSGASGQRDTLEVRDFCRRLAREAVRSLYQELTLYPKPGLVSLVDNGSHLDMNAATFMRSLFSLRHYFLLIAQAGAVAAPFAELQRLGVAAEQRMLRATAGVNTHRGAIFCLGMLCAATAACHAQGIALSPAAIRAVLLLHWGEALAQHTVSDGTQLSHGLQVAAQHAVGGAREEAALGFPTVFEIALPHMDMTLAAGRDWQDAKTDGFFMLMAHVSDTNVYHRGGAAGMAVVRAASHRFIAAGGTGNQQWRALALACHHELVSLRLSPGGAADLLAACCLLHQLCRQEEQA